MTAGASTSHFNISTVDGNARVGQLTLPRGVVQTPAFMPVGTQAAVKSLDASDIRVTGTEIILANTYHLMLRPGGDLVEAMGGVSHFMRWEGPVLTDSGGFQVFSLARNRVLSEEGVTFRSHIDGSTHHLSPERSVELQCQFASDIVMALDVLAGYDATDAEQVEATRLTHAWLPRNIDAFRERGTAGSLLFGICQGGFDRDRRRDSAATVAAARVDGCAIGGLSVGEPKSAMLDMLRASIAGLPSDRPRYLMGVGSPEDLWTCVAEGVDMFDCVLPTRVARRGALYTPDGRVNVAAARFRQLDAPVDPDCDCPTCLTYGAAYVHHLFRAGELLGYRLATLHNVRFMQRQMSRIRASIRERTFDRDMRSFLDRYRPADEKRAIEQRARFRRARANNA
jgi:queuine tRNA-ribosyltransferase